tara:strand:+ start:41 stop:1717 length:1677 start_codon:yes stop_codon:yes gene_type:complete
MKKRNIIDLQEDLKDLPDRRLMQEMQMPTGNMPQFLVLSELQRRKRMRDDFKRQEAADMPTVAEEIITGAGVPQEGIMAMAGAMAPKTNVAQDTGLAQAMPMQATRAPQPQMMAEGGFLDYLKSVLGAEKPDRSIDAAIGSRVSPDLDDFLAQDSMREFPNSVPGSMLQYPSFLPYPTASGSFGNDAELAMGKKSLAATLADLPQTASNTLAVLDEELKNPELTDSERKALGVQRSALNAAISTGQFIDDTVADSVALINRVVANPLLDLAAGATSIVNPDAGAKVFNFADEFEQGTDKIAEQGFIPETRKLEDIIAPKADEYRGDDIVQSLSPSSTTIADDAPRIAPKADEYRGDDPLTILDSATDGGADGAGFGSAESEMSKLLSDRRKRADQNKWLALAEAGFAMMGPAATFGEGIGKGGKAGLASLRESQKGMDAFETDMLKLQASMNIADARNQTTLDAANIRSDATLKAALARLKGSAKNAPVGLVTAAASQVDDARTALQFARTDPEKLLAKNALDKAQATFEEIFNRVASQFPATSDMSTTTLSGRTQVG